MSEGKIVQLDLFLSERQQQILKDQSLEEALPSTLKCLFAMNNEMRKKMKVIDAKCSEMEEVIFRIDRRINNLSEAL